MVRTKGEYCAKFCKEVDCENILTLLSCHFQCHVLFLQFLIQSLHVLDVFNGFPQNSRLVQL